jgi:hypothetical protein
MPNELWTAADVIGKKDAEIARLKDELAKQMLADEMLRGLYDDEAADVARLNAELRSMRAGQDALVAAVCDVAASMIEDNMRHAAELGREIWPIPDIRALTTADATAAMNAKLRAERNRALRDAADADWSTGRDVADHAPEYLTPWQRGLVAGMAAKRDAILAMIEPETNNDR